MIGPAHGLCKPAGHLLALLLALWTLSQPECAQAALAAGDKSSGAEKQPAAQAEAAEYAPPFPLIFLSQDDPSVSRGPLAKIVTESVTYMGSITTQEEYIDMQSGKHAYVLRDTQEVVYVSPDESLILKYKPYTCESFKKDDPVLQGIDGLSVIYGSKGTRVFGVIGLWLYAESSAKGYTSVTRNFGIKDFEVKYNVWEYRHHMGDYRVKLEFASRPGSLQKVEILNTDGSLLKTINVLAVEYELDQRILEVPAGFDCGKHIQLPRAEGGDDDDDEGDKSTKDDFWSTYIWLDSRVKLEVTGTRMTEWSGDERLHGRSADTIYVELTHARVDSEIVGSDVRHDLYQTRVKSKEQETRTILNHVFNVRYHIDSRTGECAMNHLEYGSSDSDKQDVEDEAQDDLLLKFSNGLRFPFHKHQIKSLFSYDAGFKPIRKVNSFSPDNTQLIEHTILERASFEWPYQTASGHTGEKLVARVMATVVVTKDLPTSRYSPPRMESASVWLLPAEQTKLLETYHMSVIEEEYPLELWPDVASLFDVSEECYLNKPNKRAGLDYAWVELFYPVTSHAMDVLMENEYRLKQTMYRSVLATRLVSSFSLPRFEVMFTDEGLIARLLLLDLPPLQQLFEARDNVRLAETGDTSPALSFNLPDVGHCARMCQMYSCLTLSFCKFSLECSMSVNPARLGDGAQSARKADSEQYESLEPMKGCVTYSTNRPALMRKLRRQRLANVISILQNQEYDNMGMPQMPDELTMPREELNLSEAEIKSAVVAYMESVNKYMGEQARRLPSLTMMFEVNGHFQVALPTKFTVESNPLDEFSLNYASNQDSPEDVQLHDPRQILEFFHAGLPEYRIDAAKAFEAAQSNRLTKNVRSLDGLTYDQCALACLDSKCGVFSHCSYHNGCVISELMSAQEASTEKLLTADKDCLVSQRDFAQHFQKFENVSQPERYTGEAEGLLTVNDCASSCVTETQFNCYSFDVCTNVADKKSTCFRHDRRRTDELYVRAKTKPADTDPTKLKCDHYERSYLAEFTAIEQHAFKTEELLKRRTTSYYGKTTFDCADTCLNELNDCSAFEFCFQTSSKREGSDYGQSCTMIQSGFDEDAAATDQEQTGYVVDDQRPDVAELATPDTTNHQDRGLLESSSMCHVFALKPNTVQAHLRSLALGQTMTSHERSEQTRRSRAFGFAFSWSGLFLLVLSLATVAGLSGFALCWARERSGLVRHHMDQARDLLARPFGRFSSS